MKAHLPLLRSTFKIQTKAPPKKERLGRSTFPLAFNDCALLAFCNMICAPLSIQEGDLYALGLHSVQIHNSIEDPSK